jgi:hypothetical protein
MMNMDEDKIDRRQGLALEQHIGTILQVTVVALLGWSLMTTQSMTSDMAVLKVKVETLTLTINQGTNDRYRGTDAAKDFAGVRQEIQFIERRVNVLEQARK